MMEQLDTVDVDLIVANEPDFVIVTNRFAQHGVTLRGELRVADCAHLVEQVLDDSSLITFVLRFSMDDEGRALIQGCVAATLSMLCQRCCQPMDVALQISTKLVVVNDDDEANQLDVESEPLVISSEPLLLKRVIEEEILLNTPMIPRHEQDTCAWVFEQTAT